MDIKLNKQTGKLEGLDRKVLDEKGTTTGAISLEVTTNGHTQLLSSENVIFVGKEIGSVFQGHFGDSDGVPGVLIMVLRPLKVGAYLIDNPMVGNPDAVALFGFVDDGNVVGGTFGHGVLDITEFSLTEARQAIKGRFNFDYTSDDEFTQVLSRHFEAQYVVDE